MAVINDPENAFDFAYKGFQYPLPPSWKYAVRLQDQIQWLLQALLYINDYGLSKEEIEKELYKFKEVFGAGFDLKINDIQKKVDAVNAGAYLVRSPFDGSLIYPYAIFKQLHELTSKNACTYKQIKDEEITYATIKAECDKYSDMTYKAYETLGIKKADNYVTPTADIPELVTGYKAFPHIGYNVSELSEGFIIPGYAYHEN